jgi:ABC-type nickel/cobalt efflux system permease component RcnA
MGIGTENRRRAVRPIVAALVWLLGAAGSLPAHPMGNFSVSHHTTLRADGGELRVRYRVDMAEIATAQEMPSLDLDGDRTVSDAERDGYLARLLPDLAKAQTLGVDGRTIALSAESSNLQVRPGAADLLTLLITVEYRIPLDPGRARHVVEYADETFAERAGWREIVAAASGGYSVAESDVPSSSRSGELENYPADLTAAPPQTRTARVVFASQSAAASTADAAPAVAGNDSPDDAAAPAAAPANPNTPQDRFTQLITVEKWSLGVLMFSLAVAFTLGSFHALAPGHGKTVVAAYLVGSRGTARHAVLLGAVVTFTHVFAVFLLGFVVLFARNYVVPDQLYPWLGFASGVTIVAVGLWQFTSRYAAMQVRGHYHDGVYHDHTGGWAAHDHHHGPGGHTHELPDRITPGSLIALGVSGGIVPCPSALVVLLGAIALDRVGLGLVLIVAFSLGLASVLILIGLLMLYARRVLDRFMGPGDATDAGKARAWFRRLPLASSAIITVLGLVIAVQALVSGGIIQLNWRASPRVTSPDPTTGGADTRSEPRAAR